MRRPDNVPLLVALTMIVGLATCLIFHLPSVSAVRAQETLAAITVDYPLSGSIFPPEITPPTFIWRDASAEARLWRIDISFADGSAALHINTDGPRMEVGEIDPRCISRTNELPKLTSEQAQAHTWIPDARIWQTIKKHSVAGPGTHRDQRLDIIEQPNRLFQPGKPRFSLRATLWALPSSIVMFR